MVFRAQSNREGRQGPFLAERGASPEPNQMHVLIGIDIFSGHSVDYSPGGSVRGPVHPRPKDGRPGEKGRVGTVRSLGGDPRTLGWLRKRPRPSSAQGWTRRLGRVGTREKPGWGPKNPRLAPKEATSTPRPRVDAPQGPGGHPREAREERRPIERTSGWLRQRPPQPTSRVGVAV